MSDESGEHLLFWVGEQEFAIGLDAVSEVTPAHEPRLVPRLSLELGGILNVRGEPLPVVEASVLLGRARSPRRRHALVFDSGGPGGGESSAARIGILVDRVTRIERDLGAALERDSDDELVTRWYGTAKHAIGCVDSEALVAAALAVLANDDLNLGGGEPCLDAF